MRPELNQLPRVSELAHFAATLRFDDIPAPVLRRTEDLLLDWFGSALAGKGARPVEIDRALRRRDGAERRAEREC